jgi:transcription antitermination factor NusG
MLDMFSTTQEQEYMDVFGEYQKYDKFFWSVGMFSGNGAKETIRYALEAHLEVFYPHRLNKSGNFVPLFGNYLFIEYILPTTVMICRQSSKFYGFISFDGQPELVRRNSIDECLRLLKMGKYNHVFTHHSYIRKGTLVRILSEDNFNGKLVRLLCDVAPDMPNNKRVPVDFGNIKLMIEIGKIRI